MFTESVHGALRQLFLAPLMGDAPARRMSVFTGLALMLAVAAAFARWLGASSRSTLLRIGALWIALTVLFEIMLGRLVLHYDWRRISADYDLAHGGLMSIALLGMLFVPLWAARLRGLHGAVMP